MLWYVSHCDTPSQREHVVEELKKYISVDIYGSCWFANKDPCRRADNKNLCTVDLYNSYKFYLAFENSNCDYYITEKYWRIYNVDYLFRVNVVPIVRGAKLEHYQRIAPDNHSFIFADGFPSVKALAHYLNYLDRNATAYNEYFQWKFKLLNRFNNHVKLNDSRKVMIICQCIDLNILEMFTFLIKKKLKAENKFKDVFAFIFHFFKLFFKFFPFYQYFLELTV